MSKNDRQLFSFPPVSKTGKMHLNMYDVCNMSCGTLGYNPYSTDGIQRAMYSGNLEPQKFHIKNTCAVSNCRCLVPEDPPRCNVDPPPANCPPPEDDPISFDIELQKGGMYPAGTFLGCNNGIFTFSGKGDTTGHVVTQGFTLNDSIG